MRRQLAAGLGMLLAFTVLTGLAYPLVVTGIVQLAFGAKADSSLVSRDGQPVGSSLLGQPFAQPRYFHLRPSAAGEGYDGAASSGSNLGPTSDKLLHGQPDDPATPDEDESFAGIEQRVAAYRELNGLDDDVLVPVDAVTASASGLDPHISVANARLQAPRVARERNLPIDDVHRLIDQHTTGRTLGFLGEPAVNVLELNLALDDP
jgi:potassium-transporting ATPase KdpC subunit